MGRDDDVDVHHLFQRGLQKRRQMTYCNLLKIDRDLVLIDFNLKLLLGL